MKILSGTYTADSGVIYINGKQVQISFVDSAKLGIGIVYQELGC